MISKYINVLILSFKKVDNLYRGSHLLINLQFRPIKNGRNASVTMYLSPLHLSDIHISISIITLYFSAYYVYFGRGNETQYRHFL